MVQFNATQNQKDQHDFYPDFVLVQPTEMFQKVLLLTLFENTFSETKQVTLMTNRDHESRGNQNL